MKRRQWLLSGSRSMMILFFTVAGLVLLFGQYYKHSSIEKYIDDYYTNISADVMEQTSILIAEKKNTTLALAMSIAQRKDLVDALSAQDPDRVDFRAFSGSLRDHTDFKNVWIQLIDRNGRSFTRSWTDKRGDDLKAIRDDVRMMLDNPVVRSSISVGRFDLTFKSMVPLFDKKGGFAGIVEVITHFNSIVRKLEEKGLEAAIVVDRSFEHQLVYADKERFINGYMIANQELSASLLENIKQRGIENFVMMGDRYAVDPDLGKLILNYRIFNSSHNIIGYIVMTHPLLETGSEGENKIRTLVDIYMLVAIVLFGIVFYVLARREVERGGEITSRIKNRIRMVLIMIFIAVSILYSWISHYLYVETVQHNTGLHTQREVNNYAIVYQELKRIASIFMDAMIKNDNVLEMMARAGRLEGEAKDGVRKALYEHLIKQYDIMKKYDVRQLHFHLADNESFLRFHRPERYGDNLTGIRKTVEEANSHLHEVDGFEEGRIYNGYRFVYPLYYFDKSKNYNIHVGSVEISFSSLGVLQKFMDGYDYEMGFVIKADVMKGKVFNNEQSNYTLSPFDGYLYEKEVYFKLMEAHRQAELFNTSAEFKKEISRKMGEGLLFSVYHENARSVLTFIPIHNPVTKKVVAYIFFQKEDQYQVKQRWVHQFIVFTGVLLIALALLFVYRELLSKLMFRNLMEKNQAVLDAQDTIVLLTNGAEIKEANKAFLSFTGFYSVDAFREYYSCICDLFVDDGSGRYLQKEVDGMPWDRYYLAHPDKKHYVKIKDVFGKVNIFRIAIDTFSYDAKQELVTLVNETESINYQQKLEEEVSKAVEEVKRQQEAALYSERKAAMGEMIGIIAHQLKQPLNVIALISQDLMESYLYGELTKERLEEFEANVMERVTFMANSIDDLRNFFNPNKKPTRFSLETAINKSVNILHTQISGKGIELQVQIQDKAEVEGYSNDMQQVILNIVANARDAILSNKVSNPYIHVIQTKEEEFAVIRIKDNGGGIPVDVLPNIFDYYFSTKGEEGTGIGLHLARMIIEGNMKGSISAYNDGKGAVFEIKIPLPQDEVR